MLPQSSNVEDRGCVEESAAAATKGAWAGKNSDTTNCFQRPAAGVPHTSAIRRLSTRVRCILVSLALICGGLHASDWAHPLGPTRDAAYAEPALATNWPAMARASSGSSTLAKVTPAPSSAKAGSSNAIASTIKSTSNASSLDQHAALDLQTRDELPRWRVPGSRSAPYSRHPTAGPVGP